MKVSRLEISLVLELNQGSYFCQSQNKAGSATGNFTVTVTKQRSLSAGIGGIDGNSIVASGNGEQASIVTGSQKERRPEAVDFESEHVPKHQRHANENEVVAGLVLGILFGAFLVLILFGLTTIIVCRRRDGRRRTLGATDRVAAESELEKLTPATLGSSMSSRETVSLINPIQKPPRLGFMGNATTPTGEQNIILTLYLI